MTLPDSISLVRLAVDPDSRARARSVLSPDELSRMGSFRHDARRGAFAVGRLAAKTLIAERLGCEPAEVAVDVRDDGSIGVPGDAVRVSISHSGTRVAAAASAHPVAVDLEQVKPRPTSLYRFMLRPDESGLPDRLDLPEDERIALLWSIKESVLKGRRTGLRHSPRSLRIDLGDPTGRSVVRADDGESWHVAFSLDDGYALSVAWPGQLRVPG